MLHHAAGHLTEEEKTFVPESEWPKVYAVARLGRHSCGTGHPVAVFPVVAAGAAGRRLPTMYGGWFSNLVGLTQYAGLAENVLDHRLNSRTIYMNPVFRFLYWNMNYHVEHHMFPMVPYHALPRLHQRMKADTPAPYPSTWAAYREIIPALWRQRREPEWFVKRELPTSAKAFAPNFTAKLSRPRRNEHSFEMS
jgi:fatty acid desaturase